MIFYTNNDIPEIELLGFDNVNGLARIKIICEQNDCLFYIKDLNSGAIIEKEINSNNIFEYKLAGVFNYEMYSRSIDKWFQLSKVSNSIFLESKKENNNNVSEFVKTNISFGKFNKTIDINNKISDKLYIKINNNITKVKNFNNKIIIPNRTANKIELYNDESPTAITIVDVERPKAEIKNFNLQLSPGFNFMTINIVNDNDLLNVFRVVGNSCKKIFSTAKRQETFQDKDIPFNQNYFYKFDFYDKNKLIKSEMSDLILIEQRKWFGPSSKIIQNLNSINLYNSDYNVVKNQQQLSQIKNENLVLPKIKLINYDIETFFEKRFVNIKLDCNFENYESYSSCSVYVKNSLIGKFKPQGNLQINFNLKSFNKYDKIHFTFYDLYDNETIVELKNDSRNKN